MSRLDQICRREDDDLSFMHSRTLEGSQVQEFYAGKTLFITGVTGFMGKCLLEKLLRSCPDLKHIYVLLRERRNQTVEERLNKYFEGEIFGPLRSINPDFEKKVSAMKGELLLENLGLSDEDRDIIRKEVNVMIHNGANVKFNDPVHLTLKVNVLGTKQLLDLGCECQNLDTFMYVSTAFSHCYQLDIKEEFYIPPGDLKMVYDMIDADMNSKNGLTDEVVRMLIGNHPNIYTFTKALAEDLIRQYSKKCDFACGIYRPTVVASTAREPLVGWLDNMNGTVPVLIGVGLGALHTFYYKEHPFDLVPCDMAINALIIVTTDIRDRWLKEPEAVVYNYGSTTVNPISLQQLFNSMTTDINPKDRSANTVWWIFVFFTYNYPLFMALHILFHFFPALLLDTILIALWKKPRAVSMFIKATRNIDQISFFGNSDWKFHVTKTFSVIDQLSTVDKELFHCDLRKLDWKDFFLNQWRGIKLYILKEPVDSKAGIRRYNLLWLLHFGFFTVLALAFTYFISKR